jgi:hypothetical protein
LRWKTTSLHREKQVGNNRSPIIFVQLSPLQKNLLSISPIFMPVKGTPMARRSPAEKMIRIRDTIEAWESLAPDDVFYGMTLEQFKAEVHPCFQFRAEIELHRQRLKLLPRQRDSVDQKGMELVEGISMSVAGNPQFGRDSLLFARLGRVRKSARRKRGKKH